MLGERGMLGLIVPSNNTVVLPELYSALPAGVTAYETRMRVEGLLTAPAVRKMVEDAHAAADLLRQTGVHFICYCCMASSIVQGWDWEQQLLASCGASAPKGIASANSALRQALSELGAKRLALLTPYPQSLNTALPDFFHAAGFEIKTVTGVPVHAVTEVRALAPERIHAIARGINREEVDALCLLATDMHTFSIIEALEHELGLPVLSSNQALLWAGLRALGIREPIDGVGQLLRKPR